MKEVVFLPELADGLASQFPNGLIEAYAKDKDWPGLFEYLEGMEGLPSIGDYLNIPDLSDEETRKCLCRTPRTTSVLLCWETARVLSHIQFRYIQAFGRNEIDTVTVQYRPARQPLDKLFRLFWYDAPDFDLNQQVMNWMIVYGQTILHVGEPRHMFNIAHNFDEIVDLWDLDPRIRKNKRPINKTWYRCSIILQAEPLIRSIPEFGQFT